MAHKILSKSPEKETINFASYIKPLCEKLLLCFNHETSGPHMEFNIEEDINLPYHKALYCGLVVNELMTNSLKHAFHGITNGTIKVSMQKKNDNRIMMHVCDNGVGLTTGEFNKPGSSGFDIIHSLLKAINGDILITTNEGTSITISIPGDDDDS
jgi:two-component sensor histidine kinase